MLDRVEFYRAEEIENELSLWRVRYRIHLSEERYSGSDDTIIKQLESMKETVAIRMEVPKEKLPPAFKNKQIFFLNTIDAAYYGVYCPLF